MRGLIAAAIVLLSVASAGAQFDERTYVRESQQMAPVQQAGFRSQSLLQQMEPFRRDRVEYIGPGYGDRQCRDDDRQCRDRDQCVSDNCYEKCCKDLFLQCACGSFVLRCDGTGMATYQFNRCVRGVELKELTSRSDYVYYQEVGSGVQWAFSRTCCPTNGYTVWRSKQRGNPLDCEWEHFCYAPPSYCGRRTYSQPVYSYYDGYSGR